MNTVLHSDATSDEETVDKEFKVEAKDAETDLMELIAKPDARVDILSIWSFQRTTK